jgi:hypothetical protein
MLVAILVALGGVFFGIIEEGLRVSRSTLKYGEEREHGGHAHPQEIPEPLLRLAVGVTGTALKVIPNFSDLNPTDAITDGVDLPPADVAWRWIAFSPYWIVPLLIGLGLMSLREFH